MLARAALVLKLLFKLVSNFALSSSVVWTSHALRASSSRSLLARFSMSTSAPGPLEQSIRTKLVALLQPADLTISNDSWQHRHHAPMKAQGGGNGETHFSVNIVSDIFQGKTTMQRHRLIYAALTEEFAAGLHALSLKTKTTQEIAKSSA
ncbi:hypothetical protein EUX98_g2392 [Antrodiella citrinella]|uniref:BolA protein n=1 Tax=Antrodiella citrinella TaxID=2447956 RepID=A0A4S4MZ59_9APHY|nr:hypothetical protein EUX98_g2392 [Antrodiella citrinella]